MRSLGHAPALLPNQRSNWETIQTLAPYLWPRGRWDLRTRVLGALILLAMAKFITVSIPFLLKHTVDALSGHGGVAVVLPAGLILAYGIGRVLSQVAGESRDAIFAQVEQNAVRRVGLQTFEHLHRLSLRFHLERRTGGLSRAIERGTKGIATLLNFMMFNILPTILEIGLAAGALFYTYGYRYALVILACVAVYITFTLSFTEWRTRFRRDMNEQDTQANTKAIDSLLNYETVKYFSNETFEAKRFDQALARYETAAVKSDISLSLLNIGQGFIISVGLMVIMLMIGGEVARGQKTVGDFVLVNTMLIQLYQPLNFLGFAYREIKQALTDMESMFGLMMVDPEIKDMPGAKPLVAMGGMVEFDAVDFSYEKRRAILHNVSFRVPAGTTTAIVGASGAGKSTMSRILFRFYEISSGSVRIDGQDIRQVTQASLRRAIGIVPQDTVLFNDSIRYNIRYGRPDATDAEVEEAAKLARIHDFIVSLPDGYDSMVGERGLKLSGGEKQRVAIARTILKNPPILLFDEATSALDTRTEKEIQASLDSVSANRTTLMIAHRLSTIIHANEILVLDKGRIIERGRHDQLLALHGTYAAMWARQQEAAAVEERLQALKLEPPTAEPAAE